MPRKEPLRGRVTSLRTRTQSHKQGIIFGKIHCKKKVDLVVQSWSNPASRKLNARQAIIPAGPVNFVNEEIPVGQRKWNDIPACRSFHGESLSSEISKLVMRLVRRNDQDEREIDGAVQLELDGPKQRSEFLKHGSGEFSNQDWLQHITEAAATWGSSTAWMPEFLAVHSCHSRTHRWEFDGAWVDGSRFLFHTWKEFLFHQGCSFVCHFNPQIRTHRPEVRRNVVKTRSHVWWSL